ncbi:maltotransferase domain-containing protein [Castellaniella ginsengisoli]|uniref:Alpha-1,4-glucan:maltose-1-phosphate maltosyltransferase n=1 Tax=Castellaniella ginsengisoli TaxID=546114 RepID=A0AB39EM88_9BURK
MRDEIAAACRRLAGSGLDCHLELSLDRVARGAAPDTAASSWLRADPHDLHTDPRTPRVDLFTRRIVQAPPDSFTQAWARRLGDWSRCGVAGYCFQAPQHLAAETWRDLVFALRETVPGVTLIVWTPGLAPQDLACCLEARFDWTVSSLAWWDGRSDWLAQECVRLSEVAPVLAYAGRRGETRWLAAAAVSGDGIILDAPLGANAMLGPIAEWRSKTRLPPVSCMAMGGRAGRMTAMVRAQPGKGGVMLALSAEGDPGAAVEMSDWAGLLPGGPCSGADVPAALRAPAGTLAPAACALWQWTSPMPVGDAVPAVPLPGERRGILTPRIRVERIEPAVDGGAWPVKRISQEALAVSATIFTDGHAKLAANLCWRACDEPEWHEVPMQARDNDRWTAQCRPERIGSHEYRILAWIDTWAGFCAQWRARFDAGQELGPSLAEGARWLARLLERAENLSTDEAQWARVRHVLNLLETAAEGSPGESLIGEVLSRPVAVFLRDAGKRTFACATRSMGLWVDRPRARYASWYELFPRSQSRVPGQHGTFDDVIARLPDIRQMGFDVLYLPPVHPVGRQNRKGRNNSLKALPGDVGSPYAIGSEEGGHDAVDPRLGTLDDFDRLVGAARHEGMEIAMDFAVQCSPDHPWLRRHRDWFGWRPDGSLQYAENPPKKYQDIVNVAFYADTPPWRRKTPLWRALRDIVRFWIDHGVRIFRVDNPHTKPLPFWQWLIADIHARDPGILFLAEAFTRPAMMYQLAKVGFTQSYTYFTWRDTAREVDAYFQELSRPPVVDFFRPMFFTSTPDINPTYLQRHGRPGFLARAALAATGSGLWGVYSGFELCEAAALPDSEEHADSEKYELRQRDWRAPGNIRAEIAQLNAIRRAHPALQDHRGYRSLDCGAEDVVAYIRHSAAYSSVLLVIINLDPAREADVVIRLDPISSAENLLTGAVQDWPDCRAHVRLRPEAPYGIWRLPGLPSG